MYLRNLRDLVDSVNLVTNLVSNQLGKLSGSGSAQWTQDDLYRKPVSDQKRAPFQRGCAWLPELLLILFAIAET